MSNAGGASLQRLIDRVRAAGGSKTALDIRGGDSKAFYGNPRRGEPLAMSELRGISSYEPTELVITALAGTALREIEDALAERGQHLPFEPPRHADSVTLGGMVAAGLAGPARACVGSVRDHLLGATVLNGLGELLTFGGQVMKNVAGYDLARVFSGSMGILGVICEVSLKVMSSAPACATLRFEMDQPAALAALHRWSAQSMPMTANTWHDGMLHVRLSGARAAVDSVRQQLGGAELEPAQARAWWQEIRDQRSDFFHLPAEALAQGECLWRLAVPDTTPPLSLPGMPLLEWGGGQRWLRTTAAAAQIRAAAASAGGHATLVRAADKSCGVFSSPSTQVMAVHRRLKQTFDPAGIFNPGRLYPEL